MNDFCIETYRNKILSEREEWDEFYRGKKISIEALEYIEIKKRGIGPIKRKYESYSDLENGPYYDSRCSHVHIWKEPCKIKNFNGEQTKNSEYIEYGNNKKGLYCSICHMRNVPFHFKWRQEPDQDLGLNFVNKLENKYKKEDFLDQKDVITFPDIPEIINIEPEKNLTIEKWKKILYKVKYMANNEMIVYKISDFKSLLKWPWELTDYQKFKLKNPDYLNTPIFLKPTIKNFKNNYAIIN